jgi:TM2 domain-containing membrane protein YozV
MKHKTVATWLAWTLGSLGAHRFYLGQKYAWAYVLFPPVSFFIGCLEALIIGLMPDEKFNRCFNPTLAPNTRQTYPLTIVGIALALAIGVAALMATLAMIFQQYFAGFVG